MQHFRLKGGVSQFTDGRFYAIVRVWEDAKSEGPPQREMRGPEGGFETEQEAYCYYMEKVRPEIAEVLERAGQLEGKVTPLKQELLH